MEPMYLIRIPEEGNPLRPLVVRYNAIRDVALDAGRRMEEIAPTPSTLAEDHPADALTGQRLEYYTALRHTYEYYGHCVRMMHAGIMATADELGGF